MKRVLIANRGEIAVRVMKGCREMGLETVAVYTEPDAHSPHVVFADYSVSLVGLGPLQGYLSIELLLNAAKESGADAIHPGYGFLSENADFAEAVEGAGLIFIGPTGDTIRKMGSKTAARELMGAAGVPVVPGYQGDCTNLEVVQDEALRIGYPVLVKAAFGGGGKGMRVVENAAGLEEALQSATREAASAFGDGLVFLEKFVVGPSHVEVQILGDGQGNAIHVGERECSVQRRHQKVIEEAPADWLTPEVRQRVCEAGVQAAKAVNYRGAGTVEFLVTRTGEFYFLEMNTRLQVEHPVTECVHQRDLVRAQVHIADTGRIPYDQSEIRGQGHAIEARIYAESPEKGFMPSIGKLLRLHFPTGPGIRVDSGVEQGGEISVHFDPMIAKLIVWGESRSHAIKKLHGALQATVIHGVETNVGLLLRILENDVYRDGEVHTRWLDEEGSLLWKDFTAPVEPFLAAVGLLGGEARAPSVDSVVGETPRLTESVFQTIGSFELGGRGK